MAANGEISVGYMKRERKNALVRQYMQNKRLKDQIDKLKEENIEYARVFNHKKTQSQIFKMTSLPWIYKSVNRKRLKTKLR